MPRHPAESMFRTVSQQEAGSGEPGPDRDWCATDAQRLECPVGCRIGYQKQSVAAMAANSIPRIVAEPALEASDG